MSADLGALVASPHFRWMPGMLARCINITYGYKDTVRVTAGELVDGQPVNSSWVPLPDLDDPATLGCLLHLVREAWVAHWAKRQGSGTPVVVIERVSGGWRWRLMSCRIDGDGDDSVGFCACGDIVATERDAAVAALLAAPPKGSK